MKKLVTILVLAAFCALVLTGCSEDETKPTVTRLVASESCGVAPLRVSFRADATGGVPFSEPTGSNNWLRLIWDFGDGDGIDDGTSVAYHEYQQPGEYTVVVTAEDDKGERASRSLVIAVQADSLSVSPYTLVNDLPSSEVAACEPIEFGATLEACTFDPVNDSAEQFVFAWDTGLLLVDTSEVPPDTSVVILDGPSPLLAFSPDELGPHTVQLRVEDPTRSITRRDSVAVTVVESPGADISVSTDWHLTEAGNLTDTLQHDVEAFPDLLTYSVVVHNDGPDAAYLVDVFGELDVTGDLFFQTAAVGNGSFDIDGENWSWIVDEVPADSEVSLDITFFLVDASVGTFLFFTSDITPYACDPDADDLQAYATLQIMTIPDDEGSPAP